METTTIVRLSADLKKMWRKAATREELSMAAFLRLALRERVRGVFSKDNLQMKSNEGNDAPRDGARKYLHSEAGCMLGIRGTTKRSRE
jgi:hypothetical protein